MITQTLIGIRERLKEKGYVMQEWNENKDVLNADKEVSLKIESVESIGEISSSRGAGAFGFIVNVNVKVRKYGNAEIENEIERAESLNDIVKCFMSNADQTNVGDHLFQGATSIDGATFIGFNCQFRLAVSNRIYN